MANNIENNFSVPEGADPLGVGVVDLGRSSYDPIQSIKEGWAKNRQDRMIKQAERRKDYEQLKADLPTFEGINQKIAGQLNKKVVEMGDLAYQKYKSGVFSPWAKTKDGRKTEAELSQRQRDVTQLGEAYNALLPKYKQATKVTSDPANRDLIDWEITNERMNRFANVESIEGMSEAAAEGLVAYKVQPVDFQKWKKENIDQYIPESSIDVVSETIGPKTGKLRVEDIKYKDDKEAARQMQLMYKDSPPEIKKYIQEQYDKAPETQKINKDGIYVDVEDWYAMTHVPSYGKEQGVKYYSGASKGKGAASKLTTIATPQQVDGMYNFDDWSNTQEFGTDFGGERVSTIDIPMTQFDTPFVMPNVPGTIDNSTGKPVDQKKIVSELPSSLSFAPVATQNFDMQLKDGEQRTFKKGDVLPKEYRDEMMLNDAYKHLNKNVEYEAFLMSLSNYKQVPGEVPDEYKDNPYAKKKFAGTSSYTKTTRRPYKAVSKWLEDRSKKEKIDFSNFTSEVDKMLNQLNSFDNIYQEAEKAKTIDDIWKLHE